MRAQENLDVAPFHDFQTEILIPLAEANCFRRPVNRTFVLGVFGAGGGEAATLKQISPAPQDYALNYDFAPFMTSISGGIVEGAATGFLGLVDGLGCSSDNFSNFKAGSIALIKRGECLFSVKALAAQAAGAIGVLIYNNVSVPAAGNLNTDLVKIPAFYLSLSLGNELTALAGQGPVKMLMTTEDPAPVPLPASLPLLLAGAGTLVALRARRRTLQR